MKKGRPKKSILVMTKSTVQEYEDITAASEATGVSVQMIYLAIRKGIASHGFTFDYVIDD